MYKGKRYSGKGRDKNLEQKVSFSIFPDQSEYSISNVAQISNGMKNDTNTQAAEGNVFYLTFTKGNCFCITASLPFILSNSFGGILVERDFMAPR